ncbi:MAG TPA: DUF3500 domain-containing protein [Planctomycetota bacterium]|nr:DUF3500 domain-containing protein [Planctomycetota bacterium]
MDESHGKKKYCPDCGEYVTRRDFMKAAAGTAAAAATLAKTPVWASTWRDEKPEDLVKRFYTTLTDKQKEKMAFPWDHKLRTKVSNNWKITEPEIGTFYTGDQQQILRDLFKGLVNPDWIQRWQKQMKDDNDGAGFEKYHVAMFGDPSQGKYEWVMSGRHVTMRCDGNSTENTAFGGPIFYGHAAEGFNEKANHPGNIFWPQALAANEVYQAMDGKQREQALLEKSPADDEKSIIIKANGPYPGIAVAELSKDLKGLVEKTMKMLLEPYRTSDAHDAMKFIQDGGGVDKLWIAFYKEEDIGNDGVWDRWALRGPTLSWYFRGSPHVHTWVNVGKPA